MEISFAGALDMGLVRTENQDAIHLPPNGQGPIEGLFVLADGMGGVSGGRKASQLAMETIPKVFSAESRENGPERGLTAAISAAAEAVFQKSLEIPDYKGMGTTVVAMALEPGRALVANVGDSRCYLWRDGVLTLVTHDHSVVMEMVDQGQITLEQAKTHPMRNVLTKVVGNQPVVEVDLFSVDLKAQDQLLLCSDGLHGPLSEERICAILGADNDPSGKSQVLVEEANRAGGPDNISVVLVKVDDPGEIQEKIPHRKNIFSAGWAKAASLGVLGLVVLLVGFYTFLSMEPDKETDFQKTAPIHGKIPPVKGKTPVVVPQEKSPETQSKDSSFALPLESKDTPVKGHEEEPWVEDEQPKEAQSLENTQEKKPLSNKNPKAPEDEPKKAKPLDFSLAKLSLQDQTLVNHLFENQEKYKAYRQVAAFTKTANLYRGIAQTKKKISSEQVDLKWIIAPAKGQTMYFKILLCASDKVQLKKALTKLKQKGLKVAGKPTLLPSMGRLSIQQSQIKSLQNGQSRDKAPMGLFYLAGEKDDSLTLEGVSDLLKSFYPYNLLFLDCGAGMEKLKDLAQQTGQILGGDRVFVYQRQGFASKKVSSLVVPQSKVKSFCVSVAVSLDDLTNIPPAYQAEIISIPKFE